MSTPNTLPLDKLHFNPYQMWPLDPAHVAELAADIKTNGLLQPPLARPHPSKKGEYQLAFGHHRRAAVAQLGQAEMAVTVDTLTDLQMADYAIAENFKRRAPTALDKAKALQRLTAEFGLTQDQAGSRFSLTGSAVSNLLRMLKLPAPLQTMVEQGELPERAARQLVSVSALAPQEVVELGKAIAQAKPEDRDETLADGLADILAEKGRGLYDADFELSWPTTPIPVANPTGSQPAELRACVGCAHFFKRENSGYCTLPACFDLKQAAYQAEDLQAVSAKLHIPLATSDEHTTPLFMGNDDSYSNKPKAVKLIAAGAKQPALGLRIVGRDPKLRYGWWLKDVLNNSSTAWLATTDKAAVAQFLKALDARESTGKAATIATANSKLPTAAQLEKQKAIDEELREEKRAERAARQRAEQDVMWVVKHFSRLVADQLTLSGSGLAYVVAERLNADKYRANNFSDGAQTLREWYDSLFEQAKTATTKDADALRRQILVASEAFGQLPYNGPEPDSLAEVVESLKDLGTETAKPSDYSRDGESGFGVRLPKGWDKPPVHHSAYNCWQCGAFAGGPSRKLSGKDKESGWHLAADSKVLCPIHAPSTDKPVGVAEITRENKARLLASVKARKAKPVRKTKKGGKRK